jgi:hypothetical protein
VESSRHRAGDAERSQGGLIVAVRKMTVVQCPCDCQRSADVHILAAREHFQEKWNPVLPSKNAIDAR